MFAKTEFNKPKTVLPNLNVVCAKCSNCKENIQMTFSAEAFLPANTFEVRRFPCPDCKFGRSTNDSANFLLLYQNNGHA